MTTMTPESRVVPLGEPKPIIPPLASFYLHARELWTCPGLVDS